jgi:hypothetical protein
MQQARELCVEKTVEAGQNRVDGTGWAGWLLAPDGGGNVAWSGHTQGWRWRGAGFPREEATPDRVAGEERTFGQRRPGAWRGATRAIGS